MRNPFGRFTLAPTALALALISWGSRPPALGQSQNEETNDLHAAHGTALRPGQPVAPRLNQPVNDLGLVRFMEIEGRKLLDNTESIYYDTENRQQKWLQMVLKNCTPAAALEDLVQPRPTGSPRG